VAALPLALSSPYYLSILVFVALHGLIAVGLSLLMGYAGQISLGHAAFYGMGAYASAILTTRAQISPALSALLACLLTAAVAYLIGLPTLRLRGHYLAMATLGFGEIVYVVMTAWIGLTGGPSGIGNIHRLSFLGFVFDTDLKVYYLSWAVLLAALLCSLHLIHSRVGRALRAIHSSETAAACLGIDIARYKVAVFVLSAVYASLAGSLYAHFVTFVSPESFGISFSILVVTMTVLGGRMSVWGALLGAAILTLLPETLRAFKDYDILAYGAILLLAMVFLPRGLFGALEGLFRRRAPAH
jgi:branched-chain amino acid transport system permease protein